MYSLRENHKEFIRNNKLLLKLQERFKKKKHVFTEVNKITLSANNDKRIQSIYSTKIYAYGTSKDLVCKVKDIKCNNIIKQYKND